MYKIKCDKCGMIHEIEVDMSIVDEDPDRGMGTEYIYNGSNEFDCDCGQEISILVEGSEYPVGADIEIYNIEVSGGTLV